MNDWYYLKHRKPVPFGCTVLTDPKKFFILSDKHFKGHERRIRFKRVNGYRVSTVFLGLDHQFVGSTPILFETMVFKGIDTVWSQRCSTHRQALYLHRQGIEWARSNGKN